MKSSIRAAEKAAAAAQTSADALPVVERAYVYPIIISARDIADCIDAPFFYSSPTQDDIPSQTTTEITFKIKNYGKTPAILKDAYAGLGIYSIGAAIGLSIPEAILGEMETTNILTTKMQVGLTRQQAVGVRSCTAIMSFSGQITFDDIWGNEHVTDFFFAWDKDINQMALRSVSTKPKT